MLVGTEQEYIGVSQVSKNCDEFVLRFVASFLGRLMADEMCLKFDNGPGSVQLAEKTTVLRHAGRARWSRSPGWSTRWFELPSVRLVRRKRALRHLSSTSKARTGADVISRHGGACAMEHHKVPAAQSARGQNVRGQAWPRAHVSVMVRVSTTPMWLQTCIVVVVFMVRLF